MKFIQKIILVLFLLLNSSMALSDARSDANRLMNWIEGVAPQLLSPPACTQNVDIWCFRHYPDSQTYLGVVCEENDILPYKHVYAVVGTDVYEFGHMDNYLGLIRNPDDSDCGPLNSGSGDGGSSGGNGGSSGGDGGSSGEGDDGDGSGCVTIPFDAHEGLTETLRITSSTSQGSATMMQINKYLSVSNTKTIREITMKNVAGVVDSEATETEMYDIIDDYLWPTSDKIETELSQTLEGMSFTMRTTTESSYSPSYRAHPVNTICAGQTWTASAYTETSRTSISMPGISVPGLTPAPITESSVMPGYKGTVQSVQDSQTVGAGTFDTVRFKYDFNDNFEMTTWISSDDGALVKMEMSGSSDGMSFDSLTELIDLQD